MSVNVNKLQKHLNRLGNFDAQDWLEKNKRMHRNGTYRFYNKSEVNMNLPSDLAWITVVSRLKQVTVSLPRCMTHNLSFTFINWYLLITRIAIN